MVKYIYLLIEPAWLYILLFREFPTISSTYLLTTLEKIYNPINLAVSYKRELSIYNRLDTQHSYLNSKPLRTNAKRLLVTRPLKPNIVVRSNSVAPVAGRLYPSTTTYIIFNWHIFISYIFTLHRLNSWLCG